MSEEKVLQILNILVGANADWAQNRSFFTVASQNILDKVSAEELSELNAQSGIELCDGETENDINDFHNLPKFIQVSSDNYVQYENQYELFSKFIKSGEFDLSLFETAFYDKSLEQYLLNDYENKQKCMVFANTVNKLVQISDFNNENNLLFWGQDKLDIPIKITEDFFNSFQEYDSISISKLFDDIFNQSCTVPGCDNNNLNEEKKAIFKAVLKRMLENVDKTKRLETLLSKFSLIETNWRQDYDAYIHNIDFDEIRIKVRERLEDVHLSIGKILSDNQLKLIALPLGIAFIFSKIKETGDNEILSIYIIALFLMMVFSILTFINQKDDLKAISANFSSWKKWIKSYPIYELSTILLKRCI